jgi:hypothetical protein
MFSAVTGNSFIGSYGWFGCYFAPHTLRLCYACAGLFGKKKKEVGFRGKAPG